MRVCDASTSISAEFGGIRDSCLDIYHLIIWCGSFTMTGNCLRAAELLVVVMVKWPHNWLPSLLNQSHL